MTQTLETSVSIHSDGVVLFPDVPRITPGGVLSLVPNPITGSKHNTLLRFRTYKIASPPPAGSKKDVLKFLSVRSIVIAPARTGRDNNSKIAVMKTDHTNNGIP